MYSSKVLWIMVPFGTLAVAAHSLGQRIEDKLATVAHHPFFSALTTT